MSTPISITVVTIGRKTPLLDYTGCTIQDSCIDECFLTSSRKKMQCDKRIINVAIVTSLLVLISFRRRISFCVVLMLGILSIDFVGVVKYCKESNERNIFRWKNLRGKSTKFVNITRVRVNLLDESFKIIETGQHFTFIFYLPQINNSNEHQSLKAVIKI